MKYGFVTGLPRSGTAWLSNYLSYGKSCFLHDYWVNHTPSQLKDFLDKEGLESGGVCDAGNLVLFEKINKTFPDAKWVIITRPAKDVEQACSNINMPLADFSSHISALVKEKDVLKVPFKSLFSRADEIGRFIDSDWSCPAWRKNALTRLNVQVHFGKVSNQFRVPEVVKDIDVINPTKIEYYDLVKEVVNNDPYAIRFLHQARNAAELYRKLDQGKPIDIEKAKETLESLATEWAVSPFLLNFGKSVVPSIVSALEKYRNEKTITHCPIDTELLTAVTYIFKGNEGVKEYMPKVRELSDKILGEKQ